MPKTTKHNYDISVIEKMENAGFSVRDIARKMGWPETNTQSWINRNFIKHVDKKVKYESRNQV